MYIKNIDFYNIKKDIFVNKEIDFAEFFKLIRREELLTDQEANNKIFVNKKVEEPIIFDPNESWS